MVFKKNNWIKKIASSALLSSSIFLGSGCSEEVVKKESVPQTFRNSEFSLEESLEKPVEESDEKVTENMDFYLGVNYVSWTTEAYPFTTSWKPETYEDSQAIIKTDITNTQSFKGKGSLELTIDADGRTETHKNGEVFVDLRYPPNYDSSKPIKIIRDSKDNPLGVDLSGKTVAAVVFCPYEIGGPRSSPNGVQLFLKSFDSSGGEEKWSSYYGNWHNIYKHGKDEHAKKELGDIHQNKWSLLSLNVPEKENVEEPVYGYCDEDFNPERVVLVGLKYGLNRENHEKYSGKMFIDNLGWRKIVQTKDGDFNFNEISHSYNLDIWEHLRVNPGKTIPFKEGFIFNEANSLIALGDGVTFEFECFENPLDTLQENNYNVIGVVQTEYMRDSESLQIKPNPKKSHTLEELESLAEEINSRGLGLMFKPHVDVEDDTWRGLINPRDRDEWFRNYRDFIGFYSKLAEKHNAEMFAVGTEFKSLTGNENRENWERVIEDIRDVYSGKLTYAANWDNYENVCFWDLVDVVGIDAYFPLSDKKDPSLDELVQGWSKWKKGLSEFQERVGKDIVFTEIGYRPIDFSAKEPNEFKKQGRINQKLQARCYEAVIKAFEDKPWFKGVFFWDYRPEKDYGGKFNIDFTTRDKLAEEVFAE